MDTRRAMEAARPRRLRGWLLWPLRMVAFILIRPFLAALIDDVHVEMQRAETQRAEKAEAERHVQRIRAIDLEALQHRLADLEDRLGDSGGQGTR
ncbi:MAG: hypothetical protein QM675_01980 [Protaetiibacter sp.]